MFAHDARIAALGRLSPVGARIAAGPVAGALVLLACGAAAGAATVLVQLEPRMPGHAILRGVLPLTLGLSLVPRRGGATLSAVAAAVTAVALGVRGDAAGLGALTSLVLFGPVIDVGLQAVDRGARLLATFAACGVGVNVVAFLVKVAEKLALPARGRPIATWWQSAALSYVACGLVAGLVAAALFFRVERRAEHVPDAAS